MPLVGEQELETDLRHQRVVVALCGREVENVESKMSDGHAGSFPELSL